MFAAENNVKIIVNYLSLRTKNLNSFDKNGYTILMHQIFKKNYKLATRLIFRGALVD
jgi:ankyrin repeat protein